MSNSKVLNFFWSTIRTHNHFLIISHFNPDGDAVSSSVGFYMFLTRLNKKVDVFNVSGQTKIFNLFLKKQIVQPNLKSLNSYEAIFVLDCGDLSRTGVENELLHTTIPIFNIDHHNTNTYFGTYNIVNKKAKATAEIIFDILNSKKMITKSIGKVLLYGMMTDTLILQTPNIDATYLKKVTQILEMGVSFPKTIEPILYSKSFDDIKALQFGLKRMKSNGNKTVFWSSFSKAIISKKESSIIWKTGILRHLLSIYSAQIVFLLAYKDKNTTLVELRSKSQYDVSKIALELGGGGHKNALGAQLSLSIRGAELEILKKIKKYYPRLF